MSDFIFSTHARERLKQRGVSEHSASLVLQHPDKTFPGKKPGTVKFIRTLENRQIHLVATYLNDQKKWLIVSAWVRGEDDAPSLLWQVLSAPFKLLWWIIKKR